MTGELREVRVNGRKPLERDTRSWDVFVEALKNNYDLDTPQFQAASTLNPIEKGFVFKKADEDEHYRILHVEPLLDQAANLLDRCVAARQERDQYAIEKFKLETDLDFFFKTDEINDREIKSGLYTVPYERAVYDALAESELEAYADAAKDELNKAIFQLKRDFQTQLNARFAAIWIPTAPQYGQASNNDALPISYVSPPDEKPKDKLAVLQWVASVLAQSGLVNELYGLFAQYSSYRGTAGASGFRKQSMSELADWNQKDISFKRERKEAALAIAIKRANQTTTPNGVLNYSDKIDEIEKRFLLDYREAVARLNAVSVGLKQLYGYSDPQLGDVRTNMTFDETALWTRKAINWLVRFSRLEQNYVLPISVKRFTSSWPDGLRKREWSFVLTEDAFPNQRNIRLRGVGAAVVGKDVDGLWRVVITPPKESFTRHHASGEVEKIDQSGLPNCVLGRVTSRYGYREAEITGINALYNASPFGQWLVSISGESIEGITTDKISDLQIDLHLAVRSG
jgi:hypothetical protein